MTKPIKLIQVGNSIAMTIPAEYRRALGLKLGDLVYIEMSADRTFTVRGLADALQLKRKTTSHGAGEATRVNRHIRVPRN